MKIIAQRKSEKKRKEGGEVKMKRLMVMAVVISMVLASSHKAFAYWKAPVGVEVHDPAVISAVVAEISLR